MENYHLNLDLQDIFYVNHLGEKCVEVWKDVPNYEGLYQVSDLGRVKSLPMLKNSSRNTQKTFLTNEKILKQSFKDKKYLRLNLGRKINAKPFCVHKLVAMAFLNYFSNPKKICVDHINNISTDNRLINLQIISIRENSTKDRKNKSGFKCVYYKKNKYVLSIQYLGRKVFLGSFSNANEANEKYNEVISLINQDKDISHLIKSKSNINGFKGVKKELNKFQARIYYKSKFYSLGNYDTPEEAGKVYEQALKLCRENKSFEHLIKRYQSKTKSKGVSISGNKFRVRFFCNGKHIDLGTYNTLEEATKRYEQYVKTVKPIS
jgi:hypothetical protein